MAPPIKSEREEIADPAPRRRVPPDGNGDRGIRHRAAPMLGLLANLTLTGGFCWGATYPPGQDSASALAA